MSDIAESAPAPQTDQDGLAVLLGVYLLWGALPLYWKLLVHVHPFEVLCHRSFWGFFFVCFILWRREAFGRVRDIFRTRRSLTFMLGCSMAHLFGWGVFVWAVSNNMLLEASLGMYILPLLSVAGGYLFFSERPRALQWCALALAACGVLGMIVGYGAIPWVSLLMAGNSLFFTVCRKKAPVEATPGLLVEMILSAPLVWGYLIYLHSTGQASFGSVSMGTDIALIGAGIVTMIPQLGFAYGISRVSLTTLSLLQYITPTSAFLLGVFMFAEPFGPEKMFAFGFIWTGVILFSIESFIFLKRNTPHKDRPLSLFSKKVL